MNLNRQNLYTEAVDILRKNDRGSYTVPSPLLYPHQWAWDSAFAAIGWSHVDPKRALIEMQTLFGAQWEDGRVPHIRFDPNSSGYSPGPELWRCSGTSSITQPPVFAFALRRIIEAGISVDDIRPLVIATEKAHLFFKTQRDPNRLNLVAVAHPWESGLDNSPAWDEPLKSIDPRKAPHFERTDQKIVTDPKQRPTNDQYRRYLALVSEIADKEYGLGSFVVYDPMMTAILARAEQELAELAIICQVESKANERAKSLRKGLIEKLWNSRLGRFEYLDTISNKRISSNILAAYVPLIIDDLPEDIVQSLKTNLQVYFNTNFPFPTTSTESTLYDPFCYWRGPVWINMNWLLAKALGNQLVESTLALVEQSGFREYFNPETGEGLGAENFTWTAALVIDWLDQLK
ncbi:MAG: hypothetical protein P9L92_05600 [Candidatus Electryonea clarkiae]|nr:hypothetical protein [Candidatus Electryonea clarkiae]MDP8289120.1 hypothetical protein [Candidatus Electryonea clarkiae]